MPTFILYQAFPFLRSCEGILSLESSPLLLELCFFPQCHTVTLPVCLSHSRRDEHNLYSCLLSESTENFSGISGLEHPVSVVLSPLRQLRRFELERRSDPGLGGAVPFLVPVHDCGPVSDYPVFTADRRESASVRVFSPSVPAG